MQDCPYLLVVDKQHDGSKLNRRHRACLHDGEALALKHLHGMSLRDWNALARAGTL